MVCHRLKIIGHALCFFTFIFLFTHCSSRVNRDGPPPFYVDETRIPDAVPKREPLAKYGNMPYYYVFGKRYHVLPSSRHYRAIGTASWYGTQFHQRKTSSGEPYNMLAMTAAHKSLPLPTYVEVTNLANHRKVIVKVNDRGPFSGNRLIDLSYVAAKKLGMIGHGTATVKIKAIDPYHYLPTPTITPTLLAKTKSKLKIVHQASLKKRNLSQSLPHDSLKKSVIYLQVGAFKNKHNAFKLKFRLQHLFNQPVIIVTSLGNSLYHVQIGPIKNTMLANNLTKRLQAIGFKPNKLYQTS